MFSEGLQKERVNNKVATLFGKPKKKVIKHPGALKRAAAQHGRSTLQEAEVEAHSKNKHIRSRGILGERFIEHKL